MAANPGKNPSLQLPNSFSKKIVGSGTCTQPPPPMQQSWSRTSSSSLRATFLFFFFGFSAQAPFVATETFLFAGSLMSAPNLWAASFSFSFSFLEKRKIGFSFRHAEILKYIFISKNFYFFGEGKWSIFWNIGEYSILSKWNSFKIRYLFNYGI